MNLTYKLLTKEDITDLQDIVRFDNQEEMKHLIRPNFTEGEIEDLELQHLLEGFHPNKQTIMLQHDHKNIGYITIDFEFPFLLGEKQGTAWISVCIGDVAYRGKGLAKEAMKHIEDICREHHATRIELGVFAYNLPAQALYEKMGYTKFGEIPNFTYHNNQWHTDIRMEKILKVQSGACT